MSKGDNSLHRLMQPAPSYGGLYISGFSSLFGLSKFHNLKTPSLYKALKVKIKVIL